MRTVLVVAAGFVSLVAACQTKPISEMSYSEVKALAGEIASKCQAQGVRRGTPDWDMCIRQEATREGTVRANRRAALNDLADGLSQAGADISRNAAANRPVNCTSNRFGSTVNTTCY